VTNRSPVAIDDAVCVGCGVCVQSCPTDVIRMTPQGKAAAAYPEDCPFCFLCVFDCAPKAITITIPRLADEPRWWEHWSSQG